MTKILPFRAIIYNQEKFNDISTLVCPPYDIISPQRQQYYHDISAYNLVHILLAKDIYGEDKYRNARKYFSDWLKERLLIQEQTPAIYFYAQEYNLKGEKKVRMGLIGLLYLQDNNSSIFSHEHTRLGPKEDRLRLLRAVKANLSPIFVLFFDKRRVIQHTYQQHIQGKSPFINIVDEEKTIHKLWRLNSPAVLADIEKKVSGENIFIADGHHRYEVACVYRDEMKKKASIITGQEGFNYVLAYFTNAESKGLTILPVHRMVTLNSSHDIISFRSNLKVYFDIEEVKDSSRFFFLMEKAGQTEHILGMYKDHRYWLLRLKNIRILDKLISDRPKEYRLLDVSILNYIVFKKILGLNLENEQNITFSPHADELVEKVDNNATHIAFFLNPVKIQQLMSIAVTGNKLPPKSTYFYPKVLSGLVINKHEAA